MSPQWTTRVDPTTRATGDPAADTLYAGADASVVEAVHTVAAARAVPPARLESPTGDR